MTVRLAAAFTRIVLLAMTVGIGWLAGTAFRGREAVTEVPVPVMATLDFRNAGIRLERDGRSAGNTPTRSAPPAGAAVGSQSGADGAPGGGRPVLRIFGDYQCPSCQRLNEVAADSLLALVHAGLLDVVYHHAPLSTHRRGELAAEVAYCGWSAGRGLDIHLALYASAGAWGARAVDPLELMVNAARSAGIDRGLVATCLASGQARSRVANDRELARRLGVTAVPTLFLDGSRLEVRSYSALLGHVTRSVQRAVR